VSCDEITKNGTPCKRGAICWQHFRLRAQRELKKRTYGIWRKVRPFASGVAASLVAGIIIAAMQSGFKHAEFAWSGSQPKTTAAEPTNQAPLPQDRRQSVEPSRSSVAVLPVGSTCNVPPPSIYSVSLQENVPTTDKLGVSANGLEPNAVLGGPTFSLPGNQSLSDAMAAIAKTTSETGNLTLTGSQPFPPSSFDPSKMISSASIEQMKALLDTSRGASQAGIVQMATLQAPSWTLGGISNPSGLPSLSNPTISGSGVPVVLPTTWQPSPATISGAQLPTTLQEDWPRSPQ
jgi:hypothetical protein